MKAVILCEDYLFGAKARSILQRVGDRPGVAVGWSIVLCPLNALHHAATSQKSLHESADAHLIIIPAAYAKAPPAQLRNWLEGWAALRHFANAAIGVIGEPWVENRISSSLRTLVQKYSLHLITNEGLVSEPEVNVAITFSEHDELSIPLSHLTDVKSPERFRSFGINE